MPSTIRLVWNTPPKVGEPEEQLPEFQESVEVEQAEPDKEPSETCVEKEEWLILWNPTEDGTEKYTISLFYIGYFIVFLKLNLSK